MNTPPSPKRKFVGNRLIKPVGQILAFSGILIVLAVGWFQPYLMAVQSSDGIYIPDDHYQFSEQEVTSKAKILRHTFTLYNGRFQPLHVEASADCGCTGLSWNNTTLPPLGRKEITALMNSSNRSSSVGLKFKLHDGKFIFAFLKQ